MHKLLIYSRAHLLILYSLLLLSLNLLVNNGLFLHLSFFFLIHYEMLIIIFLKIVFHTLPYQEEKKPIGCSICCKKSCRRQSSTIALSRSKLHMVLSYKRSDTCPWSSKVVTTQWRAIYFGCRNGQHKSTKRTRNPQQSTNLI